MCDLVVGLPVVLRGEIVSLIDGSFPLIGVRFGAVVAYAPPQNVEARGFRIGDVVALAADVRRMGAEAPRWQVRCLGDEGALLKPCEGARRERYENFDQFRLALVPPRRPVETRGAETASPP